VLAAAMTGKPEGVPRETVERLLDLPMLAKLDAPPAPGRFPLVLWTSRYGTTVAQAPLSEWLASHGFVVAFARPADAAEQLPFEAPDAEAKLEELERQVGDLRGALRSLREMPHVDGDRVSVLAWSYAGEAATRLALGDPAVRHVIGLSTNLLGDWVYQPATAAADLPADLLGARFVLIREERGRDGSPRERAAPAWSRLAPGSLDVRVPGMAHGSFNAVEGYWPSLAGVTSHQPWSRVGPEALAGYTASARVILGVLQGRDDVPAGLVTERVAGTPAAPVAAERLPLRAADGVEVTAELYEPHGKVTGCVALLHQSGSSRGEYRVIGPALAGRGWRAIAPDLRFGRRDRPVGVANETALRQGAPAAQDAGDREAMRRLNQGADHDIEATIAELVRRGCADVVAWGSSMTTIPALKLAATDVRVRAAVVFSPGEYVRDDPQAVSRVAATVRKPVLVVRGRGEAEVSDPVAQAVREEHRVTYVSPLGGHGSTILLEDGAAWPVLDRFLDRVRELPPAVP
jgi:dienelactone hydrolase